MRPPTSAASRPNYSCNRRKGAASSSWKARIASHLNEIANTFAVLLGHAVKVVSVPRETWEPLFKSQGMKNPTPRIQMLDGFNEGWIEFESGETGSVKGRVELKTVLRGLIARETKQ